MGKRFYKKRSVSRYRKRYMKRTSKVKKSNYLFRKFIRRRALKPELKYSDSTFSFDSYFYTGTPSSTPGTYSAQITPIALTQGPGVGGRIGNQLSFVKFDFRMVLHAEPFQNAGGTFSAPVGNTILVRTTIWSPRVVFSEAQAYMNNITNETNIDFNMITVHRDMNIMMAVDALSSVNYSSSVGVINGTGGFPDTCSRVFKVKFPRKVKFGVDADITIDQEKYSAFVTFTLKKNNYTAIHGDIDCKTWYFDS